MAVSVRGASKLCLPAGVLKQLDRDTPAGLSLYMDGMHLFGPCCCIVINERRPGCNWKASSPLVFDAAFFFSEHGTMHIFY